jgi:hypothetical protein
MGAINMSYHTKHQTVCATLHSSMRLKDVCCPLRTTTRSKHMYTTCKVTLYAQHTCFSSSHNAGEPHHEMHASSLLLTVQVCSSLDASMART